MAGPPTRRTRNTRTADIAENKYGSEPGIYIGRVVSHLDGKFMGALKVMLLKVTESGNDYQEANQLLTCHYASPFTGQTPFQNVGANDTYQESQQSYGFWAVPPDIGTRVIVLKIEGASDFGFWVGCVQDEFMNFMVPDGRPATVNNNQAQKLPTGEYNKALVNADGETQPTRYPKPVNEDFVDTLAEQGLLEDDIRGLTSSSARREVPSAVFGMNTPGPLDKRDGAPRHGRGPTGVEASVPSSRLGGTSIVMDDGDDKILRVGSPEDSPSEYVDIENTDGTGDVTLPANELFRVRTRTGHQILLHNTEDLIYIGNSRGTSWIEMTSNGKIDIYAEDSVSIHSSQDLNFSADRDINLNATAHINISAGETIKSTAGTSMDFTSVDYTAFVAGGSWSAKADSYMSLYSAKKFSAESVNNATLASSGANVNLSAAKFVNIGGKSGIKMGSSGDAHMKIGGNIFAETNAYHLNTQEYFQYSKGGTHIKSDADMFLTSRVTMNIKGKSAYLTSVGGDTHLKSAADTKIQATNAINNYSTNYLTNATNAIDTRAGGSIDIQSTGDAINVNASTSIDVFTAGPLKMHADGALHIDNDAAMYITGQTIDMKNTSGNLTIEAATDLRLEGEYVKIDAGAIATAATEAAEVSAAIAKIAIAAISAETATIAIKPNPVTPETPVISLIAKIPSRIPQHEPWLQHENLNPLEYVPEKTRAGIEAVDSFSQPIPDTFVNIGERSTAGSTTASDRGNSTSTIPGTDGEYAEETLGDFQDLKRDQIYVVGDGHAAKIQQAAGYKGSPNSSATVSQIAQNQVGRIPEDTVVIVSAGSNDWESTPSEVAGILQEDIVNPLLLKNCFVITVTPPTIDLAGPYAATYSSAGYTSNYNDVMTAIGGLSANGSVDLATSDIDSGDPQKIFATANAYQRVESIVESAIASIPDPSPFDQYSGSLGPLLAAIRICEVDTAEPRGYDIVYGGIPAGIRPPRPITQMSVDDVLAWQRRIRGSVASTATGAYQFIYPTLLDLVDRRRVVPRSAIMDAGTQDRLAIALMTRLNDWKEGQRSDEDFGYDLARVWASMPVMEAGRTLSSGATSTSPDNAYYGGVATNPSTARRPASFIKESLVRSKQGEVQENENTQAVLTPAELQALGYEAGDPYEGLEVVGTFTDAGANIGNLENVDRVRQRQGGATFRKLPVQQRIIDILNRAAAAAGVYVHITSGGQMPYDQWAATPGRSTSGRTSSGNPKNFYVPGPNGERIPARTGSRRHDTGLAVDCCLTKDSNPSSTSYIDYNFGSPGRGENNQIWDNFIYHAFKFGMRGFGFSRGYMGTRTIHIDTLGALSGGRYNSNQIGHWSNTSSYFVNIAQKGMDEG